MQYRTVFVAALSATGAVAAPALRRDNHMPQAPQGGFPDIDFNKYQCPGESQDMNIMGGKEVIVTLLGNSELARQFRMISNNGKFVACTGEKFNQISVNVGGDAELKELRCAIADKDGKMIGAVRGDNVDFTFSDGGAQKAWDYLIPTNKQNNEIETSKIVCDVAFKKIDANQRKVEEAVNVLLRKQKGGRPKTIGPFNGPFFGTTNVGEVSLPVEGNNKYETLEVQVGRLTNKQSLRCAAFKDMESTDPEKQGLVAIRGTNTDTTFSDNNAGEWTFIGMHRQPKAQTIKKVVCSSEFVQANQTPAPPANQ